MVSGFRRRGTLALFGVVLACPIMIPTEGQAAGLFDAISSIFGADPLPASRGYDRRGYGDADPLGVTVRGQGTQRRDRTVVYDASGPKPVNAQPNACA